MLVLALLGYLISLAAGIIIVVNAYKNGGILQALLVMFLPFYGLYWLIFRMEENRGLVVGGWALGFLLLIIPVIPAYMKAASAVSASTAAANRDVCTLLTADQVGAELHEGFEPGDKSTIDGHPACNYRNSATFTHKLVVTSQACSAGKLSPSSSENDSIVPNLGDEAVLNSGVLTARKGAICYSLSVEGAPSGDTIDGRKNLMKIALK